MSSFCNTHSFLLLRYFFRLLFRFCSLCCLFCLLSLYKISASNNQHHNSDDQETNSCRKESPAAAVRTIQYILTQLIPCIQKINSCQKHNDGTAKRSSLFLCFLIHRFLHILFQLLFIIFFHYNLLSPVLQLLLLSICSSISVSSISVSSSGSSATGSL